MTENEICIALAGNPNSGKTTIFNNLTGSRQHVGNYPGVTVERKEGYLKFQEHAVKIIDLPGTYALSAYSPDEVVARQVIIEEKPDVLVNIIDVSNFQRNLNLTMQLLELETPMVLVLNMYDLAEKSGLFIDLDLLSQLLGIPVIKCIGTKNLGTMDIITTALQLARGEISYHIKPPRFRNEIEEEIARLLELFFGQMRSHCRIHTDDIPLLHQSPKRWIIIKLLSDDQEIIKSIKKLPQQTEILTQVKASQERIKDKCGQEAVSLLTEDRYAVIRGIYREACRHNIMNQASVTENIDRILLNRVVGLPLFFVMMWLLFQATFSFGAYPMEWLEAGISVLSYRLMEVLPDSMLRSLLVDGIIGGVGGVIVFLPNILILFLGIAFLEGTGYMSRAAFLMDKIMHRAGLHGKSFVPMIIGFGCSIPAIMATRTLENPRDRLVTILIVPLMSCGARLPVYILLTSAFFPTEYASLVLFSIYVLGILMAVIMARVFRTWLLPGEAEPFVMELPIYRMPGLKNILIQMWERAWLYLRKAGTIILAVSIIMWSLFTFPSADSNGAPFTNAEAQLENSYAGKIGQVIEPVLSPLGFDWKTGVALLAGVGAKEVIVSTLATLYSLSEEDIIPDEENGSGDYHKTQNFAERARESSGYTPLTAYVLMVFTLLYVPCTASLAIIKRETNSWKWPGFAVGYMLILAWTVSFIIYRGGLMLGWGA